MDSTSTSVRLVIYYTSANSTSVLELVFSNL